MKKTVVGLVSVLSAAVLMSGCKITPEQGKVIAQNAGIYSAVIWIAVDNPTSEQIVTVRDLAGTIKTEASKIKQGQTYMEVVCPIVFDVIDKKVKPQDRPLCKAATVTILNGLDTLFAMHPDWKATQDITIDISNSYMDGVIAGLSMKETDPVMVQARKNAQTRAKMLLK